jgi:hypothetical protein
MMRKMTMLRFMMVGVGEGVLVVDGLGTLGGMRCGDSGQQVSQLLKKYLSRVYKPLPQISINGRSR